MLGFGVAPAGYGIYQLIFGYLNAYLKRDDNYEVREK
jgi:hypothetical protein